MTKGFDTIRVLCPACLAPLVFEGPVKKESYDRHDVEDVPRQVAVEMDGAEEYCECGETVTLRLPGYSRVKMVPTLHWDDGESDSLERRVRLIEERLGLL